MVKKVDFASRLHHLSYLEGKAKGLTKIINSFMKFSMSDFDKRCVRPRDATYIREKIVELQDVWSEIIDYEAVDLGLVLPERDKDREGG